jgi:hypothetical protein
MTQGSADASVVASDSDEDIPLQYLAGFCLAMPIVSLAPLVVALAFREVQLRMTAQPPELWGYCNAPVAIQGLLSGAMWASANVLSVHCTMRLGQAVGFPLTQTCVVLLGIWGILYFGEPVGKDATALTVFIASALAVCAAAVMLKLSAEGEWEEGVVGFPARTVYVGDDGDGLARDALFSE